MVPINRWGPKRENCPVQLIRTRPLPSTTTSWSRYVNRISSSDAVVSSTSVSSASGSRTCASGGSSAAGSTPSASATASIISGTGRFASVFIGGSDEKLDIGLGHVLNGRRGADAGGDAVVEVVL